MKRSLPSLAAVAFAMIYAGSAGAQVVLDGSFGSAGALSGPNYQIEAAMGAQSGNHLFHSFETFNIQSGESVNFAGPANVSHIFGRVTGSSLSLINGTVGSDITGASLWLINPHGFFFGSGANLNLSGSFHVSSAARIVFDNNEIFDVTAASPTLSVAAPAGFGFLQDIHGGIATDGATLSVNPGQSLSLIGGSLNFSNTNISAADGRVNLAAVAGAGQLLLVNPADPLQSGLMQSNINQHSTISFAATTVDVSGNGGGDVYIAGGEIVLDPNAAITNFNSNNDGGVIHLQGTDITLDQGVVRSRSGGSGQGADIVVQAQNLRVNNLSGDLATVTETGLISEAQSTGKGGDIVIEVAETTVLQGGTIRTAPGISEGGDVSIITTDLTVEQEGKIFTSAFSPTQTGVVGSIHVNASGDVTISDAGSSIQAQTFSNTAVNDRVIEINAANLSVTNAGRITSDAFAAGNGAGIVVNADNVTLSDEGVISAQTFDASGRGIQMIVNESLSVLGNGEIATDTFGNGQGSDITIQTRDVLVADGGRLSAGTIRNGSAGSISVSAEAGISIEGRARNDTGFFSVSGDAAVQDDTFIGSGGDINLNARRVSMNNGAVISAEAINAGNAGNINIQTEDALVLNTSAIEASAEQSAGGEINIQAVNLVSLTNSRITTTANGVSVGNDGGNISIDPVHVVLNKSSILAQANAGNGGNITIRADALSQSPQSVIDASSNTGLDGEVKIETLNQQYSEITSLETVYLNISAMLNRACVADKLKERSSFTWLTEKSTGVIPASYKRVNTARLDGVYDPVFSTPMAMKVDCR